MKAKKKTHRKEKNSSPDWNGITHKAISMQQPSSWHVNLHAAVSLNAVCIFVEPPATFLYCFRSMVYKTKRKKKIFFFFQTKESNRDETCSLLCISSIQKNWMRKNELKIRPDITHIHWERESRLNILLLLWIKRKEMNEIFEKSTTMTTQSRNNNSATTTIMPTIAMKI